MRSHILNRIVLRLGTKHTPYCLWNKKSIFNYFKAFNSKCYILRDREKSHRFDGKSDGVFLGYSSNSKKCRV